MMVTRTLLVVVVIGLLILCPSCCSGWTLRVCHAASSLQNDDVSAMLVDDGIFRPEGLPTMPDVAYGACGTISDVSGMDGVVVSSAGAAVDIVAVDFTNMQVKTAILVDSPDGPTFHLVSCCSKTPNGRHLPAPSDHFRVHVINTNSDETSASFSGGPSSVSIAPGSSHALDLLPTNSASFSVQMSTAVGNVEVSFNAQTLLGLTVPIVLLPDETTIHFEPYLDL